MPSASMAHSSTYLTALAQEIEKKLQRVFNCTLTMALASSSRRRNSLQDLFVDIALEVDDHGKDRDGRRIQTDT
ncbi:Hypothetical predicted protein [Olea europaea subsp. europaea]|uniref:Uncharacterized protein n=1 Tax=Olea europaea subsp. europaea TaxID=158383 RepID=A0A8S0PB03_OLEEU|nr:Hypothetical predicted protein [Olea europaea subsp. europaea]